jgi:hypothetical protein
MIYHKIHCDSPNSTYIFNQFLLAQIVFDDFEQISYTIDNPDIGGGCPVWDSVESP